MRSRIAFSLALAALAAGCGSGSPSTESVVRAWSHAINSDDNEGAANLFARGAEVVQPSGVLRLRTHADAVAWNMALPCSGRIVRIVSKGNTAQATFVLGDRKQSACDGPGQQATAIIRVRNGKIVLWHQTATAPTPTATAPAV